MKKLSILLLAAIAFAIPNGASATRVLAECSGELARPTSAPTASSCQATFDIVNLEDARYVSMFDTHGNFHELAAKGVVTLEWFDASNRLVVRYACQGLGLSPNGVTDITRTGLCAQDGPMATSFTVGTQKLIVTASMDRASDCATSLCTFHGKLAVSNDEGDIF